MSKMIGATQIVIGVGAGFLALSFYLIYKIFKLVKWSDKAILSSIICITIAQIFFLIYNIL